jgi:hypothetical protein
MVKMGVEIDKREQLIWAKANTRTNLSLGKDDLRAIATEHSLPADDGDSEWRKIPATDYERASDIIGALIFRYVSLLDSGTLSNNRTSLAVIKVEASLKTAAALENAINDNFAAL